MTDIHPTIIVGGGFAGLIAAARLTRAGLPWRLLERSRHVGGRGRTDREQGFAFNLGAHALYRKGAAWTALRDLGVRWTGGIPNDAGAIALTEGGEHSLPGSPRSLLTSSLLSTSEKIEVGKLLGTLAFRDPKRLTDTSAAEWLASQLSGANAQALIRALINVTTYVADHDRLSADVALSQLQAALSNNVDYVDGGWGALVDQLRTVAGNEDAIHTGVAVETIGQDPSGLFVRAGGETLRAREVIVALPYGAAVKLLPQVAIPNAEPGYVACLDLGLDTLPSPERWFALGFDAPTYLSVHSRIARLAPEGAATVHVMRYLRGDERVERQELEAVIDRVQPGWRSHVVTDRFLPRMTAVSVVPTRGRAGRPAVDAAGLEGVHLAGDWVGPIAHLVDASAASAEVAAAAVIERHRTKERAA